ncbi:RNA methyltransferase [bacterium]|nr:RNA methyltransferase [bacterium]
MISKSQIKLIRSLQQKKYRSKLKLFVAEGPKVINELLTAKFKLHSLYVTVEDLFTGVHSEIISDEEISKISFLKNANNSVAVFTIPEQKKPKKEGITLLLDSVRDPGNLGTIIRLSDWFNVSNIICSSDSVDCFNPKVIQATMGSISRVSISYCDLTEYLSLNDLPVYAGTMDGKNIYKEKLPENAIVIVGNEANGISDNLLNLTTHKIGIPRFGNNHQTESLNVAVATAILFSEFKRFTE